MFCCLCNTKLYTDASADSAHQQQIVWPTCWIPDHADFQNAENVPVVMLTVDGVHCCVHEPQHPTKSKNPSLYSHKFKQSAINNEMGITTFDNALLGVDEWSI